MYVFYSLHYIKRRRCSETKDIFQTNTLVMKKLKITSSGIHCCEGKWPLGGGVGSSLHSVAAAKRLKTTNLNKGS